ncbi:hypothetical protein EAF04_009581 [Stromatinia cepivora]|nr:hypothetical protein EAF04_009581 [Stromatinia cepivora]
MVVVNVMFLVLQPQIGRLWIKRSEGLNKSFAKLYRNSFVYCLSREVLRFRAGEMVHRGLKALDELDEAEEKEKLEKEYVEKEKEALGSLFSNAPGPGDASLDASFFDPLDPDDPLWATLGIAGGMPEVSQGN